MKTAALLCVTGLFAAGLTQAPPRATPQPQVPRVTDLMQMMAALPDSAPAKPKQPRRVLVLARATGFVHSSIPLTARTIEALKTGAWNTVITYARPTSTPRTGSMTPGSSE
jgi:hypothetical protein